MSTNNFVELTKAKFEALLTDTKKLLDEHDWDGNTYRRGHPSSQNYVRIRTEALNLLRRVCGEDSDHYKELVRLATDSSTATNGYWLFICCGIIEAAERDFSGGYLFDLRSLIAAELLGDFTEQAEYLLEEGFFIPAASLAGAVLEDALRKLSQRHGLPVPIKTKIDSLNVELARAQIYNTLVQKRITALADIRNNADHGRPDKFKREDVADMISYIKRFCADYLS